MEVQETQGADTRSVEHAECVSSQQLDHTPRLRPCVCRNPQPVQGPTRPPLEDGHVQHSLSLRATLVQPAKSSVRIGPPGQVAFVIPITILNAENYTFKQEMHPQQFSALEGRYEHSASLTSNNPNPCTDKLKSKIQSIRRHMNWIQSIITIKMAI